MKRTFCDMCHQEITENNIAFKDSEPFTIDILKGSKPVAMLSIEQYFYRISKPTDICKYCVFDAVYKADDRK